MAGKDRGKNGAAQQVAAEEGLPLEELGDALSKMMARGADPYVKDAETAKLEEWANAPDAAKVGGDLTPRAVAE